MTFASETTLLIAGLRELCQQVFLQTLEYNPLERLPRGWDGITAVLDYEW